MTTPEPDTSAPRCRTATGALDIACYERQARQLRAQFMHARLSRLLLLLGTAWRQVKTRFRRLARQRELNALDDHALRDLGLDRSDLSAIASGAFFADASRRQRGVPKTHPSKVTQTKNTCMRHSAARTLRLPFT